MKTRIGLREIRALTEGTEVWDSSVAGFGARRQRSDAISYILMYRNPDGRQRRYTIGRHGAPWTPDTARREAQRILGLVAGGNDPAETKKEARHLTTVAELCDVYLEDAKAGVSERPPDLSDAILAASCGLDARVPGWQAILLERAGEAFEKSGDPLQPWHVMSLAERWNIPPPSWAVSYFSSRAKLLNNIVRDNVKDQGEAERAGRALGFGATGRGRTTSGENIRIENRYVEIAFHVLIEIERNLKEFGTQNRDSAVVVAARHFDVSEPTVRRVLKAWEGQTRTMLEYLIEQDPAMKRGFRGGDSG